MLLSNEAKQRLHAFWAGGAYERCCLHITASAGKQGESRPPAPASTTQAWEDLGLRTRMAAWNAENTLHFAEAVPSAFVNFGPGCLAAMVGGTYQWAPGTVWFENEPLITDWADPPPPVLNKASEMYQLADAFTEKLLAAGEVRFFTSITDIGGSYDILAALRGTQNLLLDLYDHPEEVKAYAEQLQPVWMAYFNQYAQRAIKRQGGVTNWMSIWSDTPWYPLQCDFSYMLSPEMFEEFILPDLRWYTEQLDRSVYHLDGPGELPHVKHLLTLPRLNAIQWTAGDGNAPLWHERWYGLFEEIQSAGKGLVLLGVPPEHIEPLLRRLSTKGLYISTRAASAAQAQEIIQMAERFGVK